MRKAQPIKLLRLQAGMTQKELSDATSIPFRTLQDWEQRGVNPTAAKYLKNLSDVLGCTSMDLLGF